jgi:uncharacterized protein YcbK (DUF882 family)
MGKYLNLRRSFFITSVILFAGATWGQTQALDFSRFSFSGDGRIYLKSAKNGRSFQGTYRTGRGNYDQFALKRICNVFQAPYSLNHMGLSLRLIEFIDFLQDRFRPGARIVITSGYRSPEYNTMIRNRGGLAAKASLHQYGMAADLKIEGIHSKDVWNYVKELGFGGAGYYQGDTVHLDVGPARSWDQNTSGVGTKISDDNKLIGIVTDYDVYLPGETITMRLIRMTAFPIGASSEFSLICRKDEATSETMVLFNPVFASPETGKCPQFENIEQLSKIRWRLPGYLPKGLYRVRVRFCDNPWEKMPPDITTPEFEIIGAE